MSGRARKLLPGAAQSMQGHLKSSGRWLPYVTLCLQPRRCASATTAWSPCSKRWRSRTATTLLPSTWLQTLQPSSAHMRGALPSSSSPLMSACHLCQTLCCRCDQPGNMPHWTSVIDPVCVLSFPACLVMFPLSGLHALESQWPMQLSACPTGSLQHPPAAIAATTGKCLWLQGLAGKVG